MKVRMLLLAALALAGCNNSESDGSSGPTDLVRGVGNGQLGIAGTMLTDPLVVQVRNAAGDGVEGVTVTWTVLSGEGTLNAATSVTGVDGNATNMWELGAIVGEQQVRASVPDVRGSPVTFTATAQNPPPPPNPL